MVLFTKENVDKDKHVTLVNLLPVRFTGGLKRQVIKGKIQGTWYPEILVDVITAVGVPVEEALANIGMNTIKVVIRMECYLEVS